MAVWMVATTPPLQLDIFTHFMSIFPILFSVTIQTTTEDESGREDF